MCADVRVIMIFYSSAVKSRLVRFARRGNMSSTSLRIPLTSLGLSFGMVNCLTLVVFPTHFNPNNRPLITVFDAILTGRQSGQKLQCLYGNPIENNFFQN